MTQAIVIGAGFAGLAAAVDLAAAGAEVTLLEGRRHPGGRAYSFLDRHTGDTVDNGQHLFMRCYRSTRSFLDRIGTADRLRFQDAFSAEFSHPHGGRWTLRFPARGPRPWRILSGFLRFPPFRLSDLVCLRRIARTLDDPAFCGRTAGAWLTAAGPSDGLRAHFWEPLCIAALNRRPEDAAADDLRAVVREAFFGEPDGAALGHAGVGLSALYTDAACDFITSRGGHVRLGSPARSITRNKQQEGLHVLLKDGDSQEAAAVVCAVPPPALLRLLPEALQPLLQTLSAYRPSPIVSVNLWLDRPVMARPVLGLLDTPFQWAFGKSRLYDGRDRAAEGHVAVVASAAEGLVPLSDDALARMALDNLRTHLPEAREATCRHRLVVRERRATFDLPPGHPRPGNATGWPSLFVAGDWTDTGLPATVESAVVSGQRAAGLATAFLSGPRT